MPSGACLLFGGAMALQLSLQTLKMPIPSELLLMLPYVITIIVLVGVSPRRVSGRICCPVLRGDK